jgi:hypothetical protein
LIGACSLQANPNPKEVNETRCIGIDVGKRRCQACVMDEQGSIVEEFVFENSFGGLSYLVGKVKPGPAKAVVESTGNLWLRIYEALEGIGVEVKLANPFKTKAIASARIKTDRLSAKILAHLLRVDLVAECYVSSKENRKVNALLRQRTSLTRIQTMVKNQVHSLLDKYGLKSDWTDMFGAHGMDWLRGLQLDPVDRWPAGLFIGAIITYACLYGAAALAHAITFEFLFPRRPLCVLAVHQKQRLFCANALPA